MEGLVVLSGKERGGRTSDMVRDGLVQLELHSTQPVGNVHIVDALHENGPGVGVVVGDARGLGVGLVVEWLCCGAVDERAEDLHAFDALACRRRHGEVMRRKWAWVERSSPARDG
jgi:hypothetical protein